MSAGTDGPMTWRITRLGRVHLESRGEGVRLELPGGWRARTGVCALWLSALPRGEVRLDHDGGSALELRRLGARREGHTIRPGTQWRLPTDPTARSGFEPDAELVRVRPHAWGGALAWPWSADGGHAAAPPLPVARPAAPGAPPAAPRPRALESTGEPIGTHEPVRPAWNAARDSEPGLDARPTAPLPDPGAEPDRPAEVRALLLRRAVAAARGFLVRSPLGRPLPRVPMRREGRLELTRWGVRWADSDGGTARPRRREP